MQLSGVTVKAWRGNCVPSQVHKQRWMVELLAKFMTLRLLCDVWWLLQLWVEIAIANKQTLGNNNNLAEGETANVLICEYRDNFTAL